MLWLKGIILAFISVVRNATLNLIGNGYVEEITVNIRVESKHRGVGTESTEVGTAPTGCCGLYPPVLGTATIYSCRIYTAVFAKFTLRAGTDCTYWGL
jgi:hypothetical protein